MGILGFFLIAIMPVGYSYAIELTYPVSEVMSNGVLQVVSQITSTVFSLYGSWVSENDDPRKCVLLFIILFSISLVLSFFIKEDLRRV
jgi:FLVCR family feline leukemia virus subgroup C receptor-related protein